jgi:DNA polymerase-3 subunit chi
MTKIDFHSNVPDKINYTCRLIRKARTAGCRIIVFDNERTQLDLLNEMLWTFSESDFLPHVMLNDALMAQTPIILTADDLADFPHHELLINLTQSVPGNLSRFERIIEVISSDPQDTLAGRERYRHYQQQSQQQDLKLTHTIAKPS